MTGATDSSADDSSPTGRTSGELYSCGHSPGRDSGVLQSGRPHTSLSKTMSIIPGLVAKCQGLGLESQATMTACSQFEDPRSAHGSQSGLMLVI